METREWTHTNLTLRVTTPQELELAARRFDRNLCPNSLVLRQGRVKRFWVWITLKCRCTKLVRK